MSVIIYLCKRSIAGHCVAGCTILDCQLFNLVACFSRLPTSHMNLHHFLLLQIALWFLLTRSAWPAECRIIKANGQSFITISELIGFIVLLWFAGAVLAP